LCFAVSSTFDGLGRRLGVGLTKDPDSPKGERRTNTKDGALLGDRIMLENDQQSRPPRYRAGASSHEDRDRSRPGVYIRFSCVYTYKLVNLAAPSGFVDTIAGSVRSPALVSGSDADHSHVHHEDPSQGGISSHVSQRRSGSPSGIAAARSFGPRPRRRRSSVPDAVAISSVVRGRLQAAAQ